MAGVTNISWLHLLLERARTVAQNKVKESIAFSSVERAIEKSKQVENYERLGSSYRNSVWGKVKPEGKC